ncbi:MAG: hypothetical protein ACREOZ_03925 [Gloeomargaritales cyanobacterium]
MSIISRQGIYRQINKAWRKHPKNDDDDEPERNQKCEAPLGCSMYQVPSRYIPWKYHTCV